VSFLFCSGEKSQAGVYFDYIGICLMVTLEIFFVILG
jgi:hypothetical protein